MKFELVSCYYTRVKQSVNHKKARMDEQGQVFINTTSLITGVTGDKKTAVVTNT
jgi:hypothetical protein